MLGELFLYNQRSKMGRLGKVGKKEWGNDSLAETRTVVKEPHLSEVS